MDILDVRLSITGASVDCANVVPNAVQEIARRSAASGIRTVKRVAFGTGTTKLLRHLRFSIPVADSAALQSLYSARYRIADAIPESMLQLHLIHYEEASKMGTSTAVVQQAYAAFGAGDIPALLELVADEVDWELIGPKSLSYAGRRRNRAEVAAFFEAIPKADTIHMFEPREFIEAGEYVTVLGWEQSTAVETNIEFSSEWIHVFTVKGGKVTRWRGSFNTAARYGI